jgi:hypothetical protein
MSIKKTTALVQTITEGEKLQVEIGKLQVGKR